MADPYQVHYADKALSDIRGLRVFDRRKIIEGIETHLAYQPKSVSRTLIKAMVQPFWSQYRLRIEDFRVYYDVDDATRRVNVLRVLEKTTQQTPEEST